MLKIENPKIKIFHPNRSSHSGVNDVENLYNEWIEQLDDNTRVIDVQFHPMGSSNSYSVLKVLYIEHNESKDV